MSASSRRLAFVILACFLLVALGVFLFRVQADGRKSLEERFSTRVELGSRFVAAFIEDWRAREEAVAMSQLSGPIDPTTFRTIMAPFGFEAAVLLDSSGNLLAVHPERADIIGSPIAGEYAHLSTALAGRANVSSVVPSAARRLPVVAIAIPFHSAEGLRVFSGAFAVDEGPLGQFMADMLPFRAVETYLVDQTGRLVAASGTPLREFDGLADRDQSLSRAIRGMREGEGQYPRGDDDGRFVIHPVPGTPWRIVASVPSSVLYEPVRKTQWLPWLILGGLAAAALLAGYLLLRLQASRDELDARLTEEVRLNEALDEFSARVAHDLRSPLATIAMGIETLNRSGLPAETTERILRRSQDLIARAITLIEDLLDLARASGTPRREPVDLTELLSDVKNQVPEVELTIGSLPVGIEVDPTSFRQAALNIARNAAKYAKGQGRAKLRVEGTDTDEGAVFSFADRGPGLAPGEGERLFMPFERGEGRKEQGTGLGLAIVGAMAKAHGGRAWYEDHPQGGAVFKILIPRREQGLTDRLVRG